MLLFKMGLIRSSLLVIVCVFLFIGFLLANSLLVVSNSLEYENIREELTPVVSDVLEEEVGISEAVEDALPLMEEYCKNNSEYVFNEEGQTFAISCDSVENGADAVVEASINDFVEEIYYDDYDCKFTDCFGETDRPYFLVSEQTKNYFENKFYILLSICLVLSFLILFLVGNKTNAPILVGSLLLVSSVIFVKADSVVGLFADKSILRFFTFLFTSASSVALKGIIAGIILIIVGIAAKFFKIGFWISSLFSKVRGKSPPMKGGIIKNPKKIKGK